MDIKNSNNLGSNMNIHLNKNMNANMNDNINMITNIHPPTKRRRACWRNTTSFYDLLRCYY